MKVIYVVAITLVIMFTITNASCTRSSLPRYEITDLGTVGGKNSYPEAMNDKGQVVGVSDYITEHDHAFFWDRKNGMVDLGTFGGTRSRASAINSTGQVVGSSETPSDDMHAFLWDSKNGMIDLGTLGGSESRASAINNAGQVVGVSDNAGGERHAFIWDSTSGMTDLGPVGKFGGPTINDAGQVVGDLKDVNGALLHVFLWDSGTGKMTDLGALGVRMDDFVINDSGQVIIGWARISDDEWHAFFWDINCGMIDLGTLGGSISWAGGINKYGQVVGWSYEKKQRERRAFIWDRVNGMINLGTLSVFNGGALSDNNSMADAINDSGQVVGSCASKFPEFFGSDRAWYWDKTSGMVKLESLLVDKSGWKRLIGSYDINNRGQIVGFGKTASGENHAFLMTLVPEPVGE